MDTERTIILENVVDFPIGLFDTQKRIYRLSSNSKIRISYTSLQDILDYRPSKFIFDEGNVKVSNITREQLYNIGLTEEEINLYLKDEKEYKEEEVKKDLKEEIKEEIKEEVKEEVKKEIKKTNSSAKKTVAKKSSTKKSTATKNK